MPQQPKERGLVTPDGVAVRILRSTRRRRTVSGVWKDGAAVISVPASLSIRQEDEWIERMVPDILARRARARERYGAGADDELMRRAGELDRRHFGGRAQPVSVRWVTNQTSRWGSASPGDGTIRLNHRLQRMPRWVQDYILVHELAHLIAEDGHGPQFKALEDHYGRKAEAKAYLEGVSFGMALPEGTADLLDPGYPEGARPSGPRGIPGAEWWHDTGDGDWAC